jgi:HlyD family secretion protein
MIGWLWLLLLLCACAPPREVEVLQPRRGDLVEAFSEEARTRIARTYPVTMPATGRIDRIDLEPGDRVRKGQVLAHFDRLPAASEVEEARARVRALELRQEAARDVGVEVASAHQARLRLEAQRRGLATLQAELASAGKEAEQARREAERNRGLFEKGWISQQSEEQTRLAAATRQDAVRQAEARLSQARQELESSRQSIQIEEEQSARRRLESRSLSGDLAAARAELESALHEQAQLQVRSPIDGVVLERFEQGGGQLNGGTRLLLLGDARALEAVAEVLTEDALKLAPGTPVELESAPGDPPLTGKVLRVEPAGFTKLSSLGVEQQRVKVILKLASPPGKVGAGYRLRARFLTQRKSDVLLVPRYSILQRPDGSYAVLKVVDGALRWQTVKLGLRGELDLEVREGVTPEDRLVALPEATMAEGEKVTTVPYRGR